MANPNKTVAAARRRMGGFPAHPPRDPGEFMSWIFEQGRAGVCFKNEADGRKAFEEAKKEAE